MVQHNLLACSQLSSGMVVGTFKLKLETSFKDERDDGQIRGI
jgi:hypothetical protein